MRHISPCWAFWWTLELTLGSVDISHQMRLETIWENCYQNPQNVGDGSPYRG